MAKKIDKILLGVDRRAFFRAAQRGAHIGRADGAILGKQHVSRAGKLKIVDFVVVGRAVHCPFVLSNFDGAPLMTNLGNTKAL